MNERGEGGDISRTSSASFGGFLFAASADLDFTDWSRVSLLALRMRLVAANLRVFFALPIFVSMDLSSKASGRRNKILDFESDWKSWDRGSRYLVFRLCTTCAQPATHMRFKVAGDAKNRAVHPQHI